VILDGGVVVVLDWKGAARRFQTWSVLKGYMNSMDEPATIGATIAFTTPWMWCSGSRCKRRSSGEYFHACKRDEACAASADCGMSTPFYIRVRWVFLGLERT
jgi:hypothetical protein